MDTVRNMISRARSIWMAAKHPTAEEMARRDTVASIAAQRPGTRTGEVGHIANPELLEQFRLLVGINQHISFRAPNGYDKHATPIVSSTARSAPNTGIYNHVVEQEIKCHKNYKFFSRLINVALGVQLVVAAALTAIGAANGSRGAITVFGAINTVVAGVMTFLKGSGMPNRLKYFQHEWTILRDYIEQRERDIICGTEINLREEVDKIRAMYDNIRQDIEANTPDRFVSSTNPTGRSGLSGTTAPATPSRTPSMMKLGSDADSDAIRQSYIQAPQKAKHGIIDRVRELGDMEKHVEAYASDFFHHRQTEAQSAADNAVSAGQDNLAKASSFGSHMFDDMHGLKSKLQSKLKEVGDLERELSRRSSRIIEARRQAGADAVSGVSQAARDLQTHAEQAAEQHESAAYSALAQTGAAASAAMQERQEAAQQQVIAASGDAARGFAHDTIEKSFEAPGGPKDSSNSEEKKEG